MDQQIQLMLERICAERGIAWLVADRNLRVTTSGGVTTLIAPAATAFKRQPLLRLIPALAAYEDSLKALVTGRETRLEVSRLEHAETGDAISVIVIPSRDKRGNVTGLLLIIDDLSEPDATTETPANTEAELQGGFVTVAAQALRSPLTVASLYLQMIENGMYGEVTPSLQENLDKITGALNRLTVISKNLQDAARIDAGQLELALQPVDLKQIIQSVVENVTAIYEDKHHLISARIPPGLPYVEGDVTRINQIVTNLLTNACKYTPEQGRITITARRHKHDFVQIAVIDSGIGVAPEDRDLLFSRFYRTASALESSEPGAGLGLYITRALVKLHGGDIWFEDNEDAGTTFYVTLPVATL